MASFMDYYQEELRKRGASPRAAKTAPVKTIQELNQGTKKADEFDPMSPVNWVMDMLSRSTYGMVNANKGNIDRANQAVQKFRAGDALGGIGETIAATPTVPTFLSPQSGLLNTVKSVAGNSTDQKFYEAFFNPENDPELKKSNADLLEYATDSFGSTVDPNYKNTDDNMAPAWKGLVGFGLDVGLDPLTYASGTGLLAGAKGVVKGVDRGLEAVSKSTVSGKLAEQAARAEKAAQKAEKQSAKSGKKVVSDPDVDNVFEGATAVPGAAARASGEDTGKVSFLEFLSTDVASQADNVPGAFPRQDARPAGVPERLALEATPAASVADEIFETVTKVEDAPAASAQEPSTVVDETVIPAPKAEPTIAEIIASSSNRQGIADALDQIAKRRQDLKQGKPFNAEEFIKSSTKTIRTALGAGDALAKNYTLIELAKIASLDKGARGQAARTILVGELSAAKEAASRGAVSASDYLSAFQSLQEAEETALRSGLGDELFDFMARVNTSDKFKTHLNDIRRVIDPGDELSDVLRNMDGNLSRILSERLGFPRRSAPSTPEEAAALADKLLSENDPYWYAVGKGLAKALDVELVDLKAKGYIHYLRKLGMKVGRTNVKPGVGLGRYVDQLNGFSQYTMLRNQQEAIEIASRDIMRARNIKGASYKNLYSAQRTQVFKEAALRVMADQAKLLDDIGAHMSIGVGNETVQLSMSEVYRGVLDAATELGISKTIDQALFNYGTQAAPTAVTNAAAAAVRGASREEVLSILTDPKKFGKKGLQEGVDGAAANNLIGSGRGWGFLPNAKAAAERVAAEVGATVRKNPSGKGWYIDYRGSRMSEALADSIMAAREKLAARAAQNEAAFVARTQQEVRTLSGEELRKIEAFLKDSSGAIAKTRMFAASGKRIEADAAAINSSPDAVDAAEAVVKASLGSELVAVSEAAAKADSKFSSAATPLELRQASDTFTEGVWRSVEDEYTPPPAAQADDIVDAEIVDEATPLAGDWTDMLYDEAFEFLAKPSQRKPKKTKKTKSSPYVDLSEDAAAMVDAFGQQVLDPYGILKQKIRSWFDQNFRAKNAMPIAHAWQNSMSMRSAYISHQLNAIARQAKKLSPDQDLLPGIFASIQRGAKTFTDPKEAELAEMLQGVLDDFFELDLPGSLGNVFLRTTSQPELVNAMLKQKGLDVAFDIGAAQKLSAETGIPLDRALSDQWKSWDIKDPLEFMHRASLARQELAFNRGVALSFVRLAKDLGAFSTKAQPGFVKIQASGKSRFAAFIPEGTYIKKELALELQQVETVFRTSREFQGQVGEFVRNIYAPLLNAWKFAITLPRPGHHIRNLIGDTSVTWMRRGNIHFAQSWKDAVKLLNTRKGYTDVNMLEAATRYGLKDLPRGGDVFVRTGKFEFTPDELYAAMAESGALPTYNIGEDFLDATGKLNSFLGKVTLRDTPVGGALGKVSEGRDHLARFQHLIQALRQDGTAWKGSREALLEKAIREVVKYHPDASLLTPLESKLRLAIPFYSWFGKIIPALVESMVMHPGRLSTINKASYNWAVANGIDPESLSNPFPDDQLFPSFITDAALGPQFTAEMLGLPGADGQYIRMNPGIAHLDVMDTLGADPVRGIAGMTSPLIRVPAELLSGGSWGTGANINDWSDYLDQSIPGLNYLANVSGVSPTGSVESLVQGEGLDPQLQVERGNKTDFDKWLSVANWVTGLGLQNLSRPNYINYAEIERRNAASEK